MLIAAQCFQRIIPKPVLVARPKDGGTVCGRYFMPYTVATAFAVTGGTNMAVTSCIAGTVVHEAARLGKGPVPDVEVELPQGKMFVRTEVVEKDGKVTVRQAAQIRNARKLFEGKAFVPASLWSGQG